MTLASAGFESIELPHNVRAIMRVDDDFLIRKMDFVCSGLMGGDFLRAYLWNVISVLNVRHLTQSDATFKYAGLFAFPPDEERRPVNVRRLAQATRLPYETVRRQALKLERDGLSARVPGKGFFSPTESFQRPEVVECAKLIITAVQRLIADLKRAGFDFSEIVRSPRAGETDLTSIARAVVRLDADYTIDVVECHRPPHDDDPVQGVIFTAVATENTRHLAPADYGAIDEIPPDESRRPVSILAASGSMKIPYETLRRTFNRMAKDGRFKRMKDGFVVPAEVQQRLQDREALQRRYARLKRFLADLQYVGMPMPQ